MWVITFLSIIVFLFSALIIAAISFGAGAKIGSSAIIDTYNLSCDDEQSKEIVKDYIENIGRKKEIILYDEEFVKFVNRMINTKIDPKLRDLFLEAKEYADRHPIKYVKIEMEKFDLNKKISE